MKNFVDLTGKKYNYLTIIKFSHYKSNYRYWLCRCDCGVEKSIREDLIVKNKTISCGCYNIIKIKKTNTKHGLWSHRLHNVWSSIKTRCYNKKSHAYKNYGGRGITMCDEWKNNFKSFYDWAMSNGYQDNLTIDRINNNGNYEPLNCRWVDMKTQSNNKRNNKMITYKNETLSVSEMARKYDITVDRLSKRLYAGWSVQKAIETPVNKNKIRNKIKVI